MITAIVILVLALGLLWGFRTGNSRFDIMGRPGTPEEGRVYLRRWWILGGSGGSSAVHLGSTVRRSTPRLPFALMLHQFLRPDADTCPHDHPWAFFTLVLWGGYEEEVRLEPVGGEHTLACARTEWGHRDAQPACTCGASRNIMRCNRPGVLLYRPAEHTHRVTRLLKRRDCWTLVLRLKKERTWGFHTPHGWIKWTDIKHLVLWCRERVS